ncbi:MAG: hypothetical protein COB81_11245, partial [Flavobacteriaceae bacterium]
MTHKEKILEFVGSTGLNKTKFCKKCGLSNGYLDSKGSVTSDKLALILENFKNLSVKWLLFDEGEMLLSNNNEEGVSVGSSLLERDLAHAKELLRAKDETIASLQRALEIIGDRNGSSKA